VNFLATLVDAQREKNESREAVHILQRRAEENPRDIRSIEFDSNHLDVIAEIKRKSPSKGELAIIDNPADLAREYEAGGASLISVLTNQEFFGALPDDLTRVREAVDIPVLRKDFAVDLGDVFETYIMDADAILLIVAAFTDHGLLREMYQQAKLLELSVLVETHSEHEIEIANELGAAVIGVNVRSLETFDEDKSIGKKLISAVRPDAIAVWESSIRTIEDAQLARSSGAHAVLVGQGLVQHENPQDFIAQMRNIS
jgi:indole-3-glycerol phosphate synthase